MKYIITIFALGLLVACGSTKENVAPIDTTKATENLPQTPVGADARRVGIDPEELVSQLDLSEDQEKLFLTFFEEQNAEMKALREKYKDNREGMRDAMMAMRNERDAKLSTILSTDQMAKYKELMSKMRNKEGREGRQMRGGQIGG